MTIAELSPVSPPDQSDVDPKLSASATDSTPGDAAGADPVSAPADHAAESGSDRLRLRPTKSIGPSNVLASADTAAQTTASRGFVDGAWWPLSDDLAAELPRLIVELSGRGYRIRRVTYNLDAWAPAPRRITVNGQGIKLGGFRTQSPAELVLVDSGGWQRTELVVVPPRSDPAEAERVFVLAATPGDQHRAAEILELAAG